jgi:hypothetical protein
VECAGRVLSRPRPARPWRAAVVTSALRAGASLPRPFSGRSGPISTSSGLGELVSA